MKILGRSGINLAVLIAFSAILVSCSSAVPTRKTQTELVSGARWQTPTNMLYMDVFLQDQQTGKDMDVARFEAGGGMGGNLENCKKTATEEAEKRGLQSWDYYCCTVTRDNPCVSKVK